MTFNQVTFNDYQLAIRKYRKPTANFMYAVVGLGGEVGEVLGKIAKIIRDKGGVPDDADHVEVVKELGDVLWFIAAIADDIGVEMSDIAAGNIEKLESRLQRGTIGGSGDNR